MFISSLRVLVLEDHTFQRSFAVNILRQLGCKDVLEAADGKEALELLQRSGPVDVALCDLRMEGMDGLEFLQHVGRSKLAHSVIITSALSGDLRRAAGQMASLLGMNLLGELGKPICPNALKDLLYKEFPHTHKSTKAYRLNLASEDDVRRGIGQREFRANFQPKFNMLTGEVNSVEVLARWHHPVKGLLTPAVFIPVLEKLKLMDELLFEQLDQSLNFLVKARAQYHMLNLAFNLEASQLINRNLTSTISAILEKYQLPGSVLTFELTENGLLEAPASSLETLVRLRMMGCRLSIDDFGAGFSSLQRLCELPFNEIKLDGNFVKNLRRDPRYRVVISNTLVLAESLGMTVVVEGVETEIQRQQLLKLGCTLGQGFLCARPMSAPDLLLWLEDKQESWLMPKWSKTSIGKGVTGDDASDVISTFN